MSGLDSGAARGVGAAMARVASRFYFFGVLLVASTIYLPLKSAPHGKELPVPALFAAASIAVLLAFPWDTFRQQALTLFHIFAGSLLMTLLVYYTGGAQSPYHLLFYKAHAQEIRSEYA